MQRWLRSAQMLPVGEGEQNDSKVPFLGHNRIPGAEGPPASQIPSSGRGEGGREGQEGVFLPECGGPGASLLAYLSAAPLAVGPGAARGLQHLSLCCAGEGGNPAPPSSPPSSPPHP